MGAGKKAAKEKSKAHGLDRDLDKITLFERATSHVLSRLMLPGALVFAGLLAVLAAAYVKVGIAPTLVIAVAVAAAFYMAVNIGANDVTNNIGAAVGARAITMGQALVMAAIFEVLGATFAGSHVSQTLSSGIVPAGAFGSAQAYAAVMMAALAAAALWINIATWAHAPVSTTHSIVGAIAGATAAAIGPAALDLPMLAGIIFGWVASPVIAGAVAALILFYIDEQITYRDDRIAAASHAVPRLTGLMAGSFAAFIVISVFDRGPVPALIAFLVAALAGMAAARRQLARLATGPDTRTAALRTVFRLPLIGSSAILCFAHGANDVSNAAGPLAAIVGAMTDPAHAGSGVPLSALAVGAAGLAGGVLLFGPRLIRLVGEQITKLNPARAFSVSLATAMTVNGASVVGLPVSTTHIAVGAVFGVGFFREWHAHARSRRDYIQSRRPAGVAEAGPDVNSEELARRLLVRRSHFMTIIGAWAITVPAAALIAAALYTTLATLF